MDETQQAIDEIRPRLLDDLARTRKTVDNYAKFFVVMVLVFFSVIYLVSRPMPPAFILIYMGFALLLCYGAWRQFRLKGTFLFHNWLETLESEPETPKEFIERAELFYAYQAIDAALADYRTALELDPENEYYRFQYAMLLWENDRDDEALTLLEEMTPIAGDSQAEAFLLRARILAETRPDEALASFDKAVAIKSDEPWFYMERANFFVETHRPDAAEKDLDKASELLQAGKWNPPDDYHLLRARAALELDRPEDALAAADRALKVNRDRPETYRLRSRIHTALGNATAAAEDAARAETLENES